MHGHFEVQSHLPPPASGLALGAWPHHLAGPPQPEMGEIRPAQWPGVSAARRDTSVLSGPHSRGTTMAKLEAIKMLSKRPEESEGLERSRAVLPNDS